MGCNAKWENLYIYIYICCSLVEAHVQFCIHSIVFSFVVHVMLTSYYHYYIYTDLYHISFLYTVRHSAFQHELEPIRAAPLDTQVKSIARHL